MNILEDKTITWDDPKFIRYETDCHYCFGNCELCRIKFMCWAGNIEFDKYHDDEAIEQEAFGDIVGRIIMHASTEWGKFVRTPYYGNQLDRPVFQNSDLLYLNDKEMVCCRRRARSVHHVKDWGL